MLTAKQSLELLQQAYNEHVFSTFQQQQLHNSSHFRQPLHLKKIKQHGSSTGNEEGERRMVKIIPQDIEGNRGNNQCPGDSKRYEENSERNEYDDYRDRENNSDG